MRAILAAVETNHKVRWSPRCLSARHSVNAGQKPRVTCPATADDQGPSTEFRALSDLLPNLGETLAAHGDLPGAEPAKRRAPYAVARPTQAFAEFVEKLACKARLRVVATQMSKGVQNEGLDFALVGEPLEVLERLAKGRGTRIALVARLTVDEGHDAVANLAPAPLIRILDRLRMWLPGEAIGDKAQQSHAPRVQQLQEAARTAR